jgi:hypothetical protein
VIGDISDCAICEEGFYPARTEDAILESHLKEGKLYSKQHFPEKTSEKDGGYNSEPKICNFTITNASICSSHFIRVE